MVTPASLEYAEKFVPEDDILRSARQRGIEVGAYPIIPGCGAALCVLATVQAARPAGGTSSRSTVRSSAARPREPQPAHPAPRAQRPRGDHHVVVEPAGQLDPGAVRGRARRRSGATRRVAPRAGPRRRRPANTARSACGQRRLGRLELLRAGVAGPVGGVEQHQPAGRVEHLRGRQLEGGPGAAQQLGVEGRRGPRRCGGASGRAGSRSRSARARAAPPGRGQDRRTRPVIRRPLPRRSRRPGGSARPPSTSRSGVRRPGRPRRGRPAAPGRRAARPAGRRGPSTSPLRNSTPYAPPSSTRRNAGMSLASTVAPAAIASTSTMPKLSPPVFGAT